VRGEEPVFTIAGTPEDVAAAKRELQAAAIVCKHFIQIRADRESSTSINGFAEEYDPWDHVIQDRNPGY